ncbi:MAG: zeta toxin family protein [Lachnospiraceae bacterium]|nr:zeta toxin family protein [Lachnospiraceae bacterium]
MSDKKPMVLFFAGPNGSGKSTITKYFEIVGTYTNADDMVASTSMSNKEAALIADKMRYKAIENKQDFTFETVLSSHYKLDILEKAKKEGYFIKGIFVLTVDPYMNISRVSSRVAQGGHDVDEEKIISRYHKSLDNIKRLMEICDILHIYDNTLEPVRIVRKHKDQISIFPNQFWDEERIMSLL